MNCLRRIVMKWRIIYLQHDGYSGEQNSKLLYVSISLVTNLIRAKFWKSENLGNLAIFPRYNDLRLITPF